MWRRACLCSQLTFQPLKRQSRIRFITVVLLVMSWCRTPLWAEDQTLLSLLTSPVAPSRSVLCYETKGLSCVRAKYLSLVASYVLIYKMRLLFMCISHCNSGPCTTDRALAVVATCLTASISEHLVSASSRPKLWTYFRDFVYFCLPPAWFLNSVTNVRYLESRIQIANWRAL